MHGISTELLYEIAMDAEVDDLGPTPLGRRRIVRVTGGTFEGPRLRGTVLPGGGDWLNRVLVVGIGRRTSRQVCYTVYAVL